MNLKNIFIVVLTIVALVNTTYSQSFENNIKIEKIGTGQKNIIFIPGFASDAEVWNETIEHLPKEFSAYKLTMPGFAGVSPQNNPTYEGWKNEIIQFIKKENIQKPIIIGHSMGGVMAMDIAACEPNLLEKIVVVDALPCLAALHNPNFKTNPNNDCSSIVKQLTSISDEQFITMQKQGVPFMVSDSTKQRMILDWTIKSDRTTFAKIFCEFSNLDIRDSISNIKCPTLVLLNSQFSEIKPAVESQYSKLKTANINYAEQSLHFIMFDAKDWYLKQVLNFIK